ncbi:hypothetical protein [Paenibacillus polymyxa]|uniref:hypothetical protein n=1 Tax=Paenibacillus polymyxa TaxID=1406 RepID=UPI0023491169|nr:hypothetical protein [Paenibacillus polymyxa]WCM63159.1 hypothetical protein OYT09_09575 [Paenibacillus polymyxa]
MNDKMSYEFKLFVEPKKVLTEGKELIPQVAGLSFSLKDRMQIYLIDTPDMKLYETGWIIRNRWKDERWELTYKRRIREYNTLENAVKQAINEGFALVDYELEVEWGFEKKALSLSRDPEIKLEGTSPDLWKQTVLDRAPQPFKNSDVFKIVEQDGRVMGPVQSAKYKSEWNEEKVHLEIWFIGEDCIAEATMKIKEATEAIAEAKHLQFVDFFKEHNILLEQDMSKTKWALEKLKNAHIQQLIH